MPTVEERIAHVETLAGEHQRRLNRLNGSLDRLAEAVGELKTEMQTGFSEVRQDAAVSKVRLAALVSLVSSATTAGLTTAVTLVVTRLIG